MPMIFPARTPGGDSNGFIPYVADDELVVDQTATPARGIEPRRLRLLVRNWTEAILTYKDLVA